jgi:hypothetical protein
MHFPVGASLLAKHLSSWLNSAAILTQPHRAGFQTALLVDPDGIERAVGHGGEFTITEERGNASALRFRATETEFPLVTGALGDLLFAA